MASDDEALDTKARRAAQAEATRAALVAAARRLFVEKGYHRTGTEEVVAEAGVGTRGALYHHFADKQALFEAAFIAVEEDLVIEAAKSLADPADGALNQLRQGLDWLSRCVPHPTRSADTSHRRPSGTRLG